MKNKLQKALLLVYFCEAFPEFSLWNILVGHKLFLNHGTHKFLILSTE